jgi:hypothetical protein
VIAERLLRTPLRELLPVLCRVRPLERLEALWEDLCAELDAHEPRTHLD